MKKSVLIFTFIMFLPLYGSDGEADVSSDGSFQRVDVSPVDDQEDLSKFTEPHKDAPDKYYADGVLTAVRVAQMSSRVASLASERTHHCLSKSEEALAKAGEAKEDITDLMRWAIGTNQLLFGSRESIPDTGNVSLWNRIRVLKTRVDGYGALTNNLLLRCAQLEGENRSLKERLHTLESLVYQEVVEDEYGESSPVPPQRRQHNPPVVCFHNPAFVDTFDDVFVEDHADVGRDHDLRGDRCKHGFRDPRRIRDAGHHVEGHFSEDGSWSPPLPTVLRDSSGKAVGEVFQMPHRDDDREGYEPLGTPPSPVSPLMRRSLMGRQRSLSVGDEPTIPQEDTLLLSAPQDDFLKTQSMQDLRRVSDRE